MACAHPGMHCKVLARQVRPVVLEVREAGPDPVQGLLHAEQERPHDVLLSARCVAVEAAAAVGLQLPSSIHQVPLHQLLTKRNLQGQG